MSDEQARDQLLSCLEDVQDQLEDLHEVTSAVVVSQAMTEIKALSSRLSSSEKESSDHIDRLNNRIALLDNERTELSSRLSSAENLLLRARHCLSYGNMRDEVDRFIGYDTIQGRLVEKHERICGVPDPDDECEECIRPLGHDGEHDFSTPP